MSLNVQTDGIAAVVRIIDGDSSHELSPEEAEEFGEELIRAARDVATEQSKLGQTTTGDQTTLDDAEDGPAFEDLLDAEEDWEIGEPLNENHPKDW